METLYKVFVSIIPPVVGILVYVFIESKRKARTKTKKKRIKNQIN